jgi:hypothetical protein
VIEWREPVEWFWKKGCRRGFRLNAVNSPERVHAKSVSKKAVNVLSCLNGNGFLLLSKLSLISMKCCEE